MSFKSKLPDVGTTIFTVMSRRARELGALNLGQGFPDYDIDPRITELTTEAMAEGHNQYAPMEGVMELRVQIAAKLAHSYGVTVNPETEVTVTVGATESLYCAVQALVAHGDEAIVFDPAYDSYDPAVRLAGGRCIHIPLLPPTFRYDRDRGVEHHGSHASHHHQHPAQPGLHGGNFGRPSAPCRVDSRRNIYAVRRVYEHVVYDGANTPACSPL
jgi:methionine aminotransferase